MQTTTGLLANGDERAYFVGVDFDRQDCRAQKDTTWFVPMTLVETGLVVDCLLPDKYLSAL